MTDTTRRNIWQPDSWWAAFEAKAKSEGLSLSAWLGKLGKTGLDRKVAAQLPERPPAHRPKKKG